MRLRVGEIERKALSEAKATYGSWYKAKDD